VRRSRAEPSAWILLSQDPQARIGYDTGWLREHLPPTYDYLARFEAQLRGRATYRKYFSPSDPFYSMYNVGPYTLAPWKVVWPEVGSTVRAAVVGPVAGRPTIPDHTIILVPLQEEDEAPFVCAILNAPTSRALVTAYVVGHPSPHVLEHVRVPRYDPANELHREIAELGRLANETGSADEAALERLVSKLWSPS
jgi:hypothetical protein